MLRFQLVSMARHHNYYGAMDEYMKEFARLVMATGNTAMCRNLERILNTEVGVSKAAETEFLSAFKDLPREIDPLVLAQPSFQF